MSSDPCNCERLCAHGIRCLGGHANYPGDHWYACEICTPTRHVTWDDILRDRDERSRVRAGVTMPADQFDELVATIDVPDPAHVLARAARRSRRFRRE